MAGSTNQGHHQQLTLTQHTAYAIMVTVKTQHPSGLPTRHYRPETKLTARGRNAVRGIALAGLIATGLAVSAANNGPSKEEKIVAEWEAGSQQPKVLNGKIVLRSGTVLRESPQVLYDDDMNVDESNIARPIKQGKSVVAEHPIDYTDDRGNRWLGFSMAYDAEPNSDTEAIADRTLWVNQSGLAGQKTEDGLPYIQVIMANDFQRASTIDAHLQSGLFVAKTHEGLKPVAIAIEVSNSNLSAYVS